MAPDFFTRFRTLGPSVRADTIRMWQEEAAAAHREAFQWGEYVRRFYVRGDEVHARRAAEYSAHCYRMARLLMGLDD